jgi:hypothetical protein
MEQVVATLERLGFTVEVLGEGRTDAVVDGVHVAFGIEEPICKVVTQKARVPHPTDRWDYDDLTLGCAETFRRF